MHAWLAGAVVDIVILNCQRMLLEAELPTVSQVDNGLRHQNREYIIHL